MTYFIIYAIATGVITALVFADLVTPQEEAKIPHIRKYFWLVCLLVGWLLLPCAIVKRILR